MRTYEAMFLLDPALATDWPAAEAEVNRILSRAEAKVIGVKNWGERKLAYQIGQHKRGLYVLIFFEASPEKIVGLERDVQLSERALRVLVVRRDEMTPEKIEKALAADPPPRAPVRGEEWGSRPVRSGPPGRMGEGRRPRAGWSEPDRDGAASADKASDGDAADEGGESELDKGGNEEDSGN